MSTDTKQPLSLSAVLRAKLLNPFNRSLIVFIVSTYGIRKKSKIQNVGFRFIRNRNPNGIMAIFLIIQSGFGAKAMKHSLIPRFSLPFRPAIRPNAKSKMNSTSPAVINTLQIIEFCDSQSMRQRLAQYIRAILEKFNQLPHNDCDPLDCCSPLLSCGSSDMIRCRIDTFLVLAVNMMMKTQIFEDECFQSLLSVENCRDVN